MMTWRHAKASIFRLELLDLSFKEKMIPKEEKNDVHHTSPKTAGQSGELGRGVTWYEDRDVLRQRSRQHVDQLSQHVETTLAGFHTFLLQLLVKSFHDDGDLQRARDINTQEERESFRWLLQEVEYFWSNQRRHTDA